MRRPKYRCIAENPYLENNEAQQLALQYCHEMGFPPIQPTPYGKVDMNVAREIAHFYETTPDQSDDPEVRQCYKALIQEVGYQWDILPVKIEKFYDDFVPYKDSPAMMDDVLQNNHLWVYDGGEDHSLLTRKENFQFRAVHDYFGHCQHGFAFGIRGEYAAWQSHAKMFSPLARNSLSVEARFQNAVVNTGSYSHLPVTERPFAEQKALLAPLKWCTDAALQKAYADYPDFFPRLTASNPRRRRYGY